ncbi:IclR family transcriptional regulator [Halobellus limi]|jgi:DNA-binding IclR family transcriptional regulator|uniref:IclR family transcriptional regulator n=1 Tax=Halobellus limi TaxID=699433 RepID=A0A1H6CRB6_9EURY|nr:IclR family transcriptional regulator [Halobellus limi]QCC49092.1 IclR family transcriptional regulator [Halobellus limi]SEG75534.1 transcriptional regulator, IclR family [Halobellus limi]
MDEKPRYAVEATGTSLRILETLVEASEPTGVTALSREVGVAKSVVHNHLSTLRAHGYVAKRDGRYEPSLGLLRLGARVRRDVPIYRDAREAVDNLAAATGETATLYVREEGDAIPIHIAAGDAEWTPPFGVGDRIPLHVNAPGKCLLASLSDEALEAVLDGEEREAFTDATITDRDELTAELRRVRDDGIAFCRGEHFEGVVGVAAPITSTGSYRTAALGVCGPVDRLNGRYLEEDVTGQVLSTTKSVQVELASG